MFFSPSVRGSLIEAAINVESARAGTIKWPERDSGYKLWSLHNSFATSSYFIGVDNSLSL
jgi:hypothetical protein